VRRKTAKRNGNNVKPRRPSSICICLSNITDYGLDSLAAVEFRNCVRMDLKAEAATLDVLPATSVEELTQEIAARLIAA
jgi:hypothetical protein